MSGQNFDVQQFRTALGSFATGVTIVTTLGVDGADVGVTANSFNSVSLDPPMILWSLGKNALSRPAFAAAEYFAVHILATEQQALSDRFAKRGIDKFAGLDLERGPGGVPLLEGCAARFKCRTAYRYEGGDHDIIVGEVVEFDHFNVTPLIFHSGKYSALTSHRQKDEADGAAFSQSFLGFLLPRVQFALFEPTKAALKQLEISLDDYFALAALGAKHLTMAEIAELGRFYDRSFDSDAVLKLQARGLIETDGPGASLRLTRSGRKLMLELLAIGKDAEETLLEHIDPVEVQGLKRLLNRLIRDTPSVT